MPIADRRARFRQLHADEGIFVMPNPWDAGSARLLQWMEPNALPTQIPPSGCLMLSVLVKLLVLEIVIGAIFGVIHQNWLKSRKTSRK